jgi:hypothetical protein
VLLLVAAGWPSMQRSHPAFAVVTLLACAAGCNEDTPGTPTLSAACTASPASGAAPLRVVFTLDVAGAQGAFNVAVDYGDGTAGSDPAQAHVYGSAGAFPAAFTVTTATQSARCSTIVTVSAPQPSPSPSPSANQPPQAVFLTHPAAAGATVAGTAPLEVKFNMCRTADPERDPLRFQMDLDGNGVFEHLGSTGADCRHSAKYAAGSHTARICVTDLDCATWPSCAGTPALHPLLCRSYSIEVSP